MQTFQLVTLFVLAGSLLLVLARRRSASLHRDPLSIAAIGAVMGSMGVLAVFVLVEDLVPDRLEEVGTPLLVAVVSATLVAVPLRRAARR